MTRDLAGLDKVGEHDDLGDSVLPHHAPEVADHHLVGSCPSVIGQVTGLLQLAMCRHLCVLVEQHVCVCVFFFSWI